MYLIVRLLVRLSRVLLPRPRRDSRRDSPSKDDHGNREARLGAIVDQLISCGFLDLRADDTARRSAIRLAPTGSSIFVAIIPRDQQDRALVLKFTDSVVASVELATSSNVQQQLAADERLAPWAHYVPRVLASGLIDSTTFVIEQCLSLRDGRAVTGDPATTGVLMKDAIRVIDAFHHLSALRQQVDARVLAEIVDHPIDIVRANTSAGLFRSRARTLDRLALWLRHSLLGRDVEIGWTHGDYHLGNVLIDDRGDHVIGVVDWGRAEPDGMTVLDKITLIVFEGATSARQDVGAFMLELLRIVQFAPADAADSGVLRELRRILPPDSVADLRSLLMLTWLKHVANNLKNEERTRAHGLWNLRTVDLVLHGAATIIGY